MGTKFDSLDGFIQDHVRQLIKPSGMTEGDDNLEALASAWIEKKEGFEFSVSKNGMDEVDSFSATDDQGALLMTYSGSLVIIGPLVDGIRHAEYASIGLRADVPQTSIERESTLDGDVNADSVASFTKGPIRKTSPILKIARFKKKMAPQLEEARLSEVTRIITEEFVEVNKTIIR